MSPLPWNAGKGRLGLLGVVRTYPLIVTLYFFLPMQPTAYLSLSLARLERPEGSTGTTTYRAREGEYPKTQRVKSCSGDPPGGRLLSNLCVPGSRELPSPENRTRISLACSLDLYHLSGSCVRS